MMRMWLLCKTENVIVTLTDLNVDTFRLKQMRKQPSKVQSQLIATSRFWRPASAKSLQLSYTAVLQAACACV